MKNICFLLACLTFLSVLPSSAMKIIVNNANDRIVYSRSSGPDEIITEEVDTQTPQSKTSYYKSLNTNPEYYEYQLRLLGSDFRNELAGTKWYYNQRTVPVNNVKQTALQAKQKAESERSKRLSREAADYYMVDLTNAPNTLVPSGFPGP